jgi:protein CpxP
MPSISRLPAPLVRSFAMAALLGATMLATPLTAARADTVSNAAFQLAQASVPQTQAGAAATATKGETVEQRITTLHAALKITPDEDAKWNAVAQSMRENAAAMDKLVAEGRTTPPQNMTAVEDLQTYQKFAQAHVDGLKNLISSFSTLYSAMPDAQKKVADGVFQSAHQNATARS